MGERKLTGGWKTMANGTHQPISAEEADAIMDRVRADDARRRKAIPDAISALATMMDAWVRLKDEGWREGIYCPKDGSEFAAIQLGSSGIFAAHYSGEWPKGHVIISDFLNGVDGLMWKPVADLTEAERARFDKCNEAEKATHTRYIMNMIGYDDE